MFKRQRETQTELKQDYRCVQYQTLRLIISETDVWKERGLVTIFEITDINVTR